MTQTSASAPVTTTDQEPLARLQRLLPLAGVGFAVLVAIGYLTIGAFPDEHTSVTGLNTFYSTHHAQVGLGGLVLGLAAVLAALFGVALASRARRAGTAAVVSAAAVVGTAVLTMDLTQSANVYATLGLIGGRTSTDAGALQAWHIAGSAPTAAVGAVVLLLAMAVAGTGGRVLPRWLAWIGLALALCLLTPVGFLAWLVFLLWCFVVGLVLVLRPAK